MIQQIPFENLLLDDKNPRLPERLRSQSQSEILRYLHEQGVLEELAQSYLDNGFFQNEPLIVVKREAGEQYIVVEGNRRLAALKILHGAPEADELHFVAIDPSDAQLGQLRTVPCFCVQNREHVHAYVGFRHIGGIKTWPAEAKARYVRTEILRLAGEGVADPFRELGRRVGSNAQGMRNSYVAICILLYAREEFGLNVEHVQESRFGVWLRCMNSADIRRYIGLTGARTYREIEEALRAIDRDTLAEVLADLKRGSGRSPAVLGDSRDVTNYGRVLAHERARATLRRTRDLSLAKQIIDEVDLEARAWRLAESVSLFMDSLHRAEISSGLLEAVEELFERTRSARNIAKSRIGDRDIES